MISVARADGGSSFDFGEVMVGETSTAITFRVTNSGTGELAGNLGSGSADFPPDLATFQYTLAAGEFQDINVFFTPFVAGNLSTTLTFTGGDNGPILLTVTGVGLGGKSSGCAAGAGASRGGATGDLVVMAAVLAALWACGGASRRRRTGA